MIGQTFITGISCYLVIILLAVYKVTFFLLIISEHVFTHAVCSDNNFVKYIYNAQLQLRLKSHNTNISHMWIKKIANQIIIPNPTMARLGYGNPEFSIS